MAFKKGKSGNPKGKQPGTKAKRTLEWEALNGTIIGKQAGKFNKFLDKLWDGDLGHQIKAAEMYLQVLEYFKPKQARTEIKQEGTQTLEVLWKRKEE